MGGSLETGNSWKEQDMVAWQDLHVGGSLFLGADTRFGPLYLAFGFNDLEQNRFYLFLGRSF